VLGQQRFDNVGQAFNPIAHVNHFVADISPTVAGNQHENSFMRPSRWSTIRSTYDPVFSTRMPPRVTITLRAMSPAAKARWFRQRGYRLIPFMQNWYKHRVRRRYRGLRGSRQIGAQHRPPFLERARRHTIGQTKFPYSLPRLRLFRDQIAPE
jgi:hypothetical protein